jgi:hypothetical protein
MEDFTTYPDDFLLKTILFNEQDNGEYSYCLLHNDFNRLVNYVKTKYNYNDAQYNHLQKSFINDSKYLN